MIAAVVLAAGRSRRMGTQKLLLPIGDTPLIARVVDQVIQAGVDPVVVVTGPDEERIAAALDRRPVHLVRNPDAGGEMLTSVRCGVRWLPSTCDAVLVVLGDQPGISAALIRSLIAASQGREDFLVVPTYGGSGGHPVLISMMHREEILNSHEDVGLRGLLRSHPDRVIHVAAASAAELSDLDEPADYERWLAQTKSGEARSGA